MDTFILSMGLCWRRDLGARFGPEMMYIWAIGLLAAGQSSTMTGTYTGQRTMEGFMDIRLDPWKRALITRSVAMVPTVFIAVVYAGSSKMDDLNQLLNMVQSIQLPFALIPVLYVCSRSDIMGEKFVLQATFRVVVQTISAFLLGLNLLLVVQQMLDGMLAGSSALVLALVSTGSLLYAIFVAYLLVGPAFVWRMLEGRQSNTARTLQRLFGHPRRDTVGLGPQPAACLQAHTVNVSQVIEDLGEDSPRCTCRCDKETQ